MQKSNAHTFRQSHGVKPIEDFPARLESERITDSIDRCSECATSRRMLSEACPFGRIGRHGDLDDAAVSPAWFLGTFRPRRFDRDDLRTSFPCDRVPGGSQGDPPLC
jgi:hypothetical protein